MRGRGPGGSLRWAGSSPETAGVETRGHALHPPDVSGTICGMTGMRDRSGWGSLRRAPLPLIRFLAGSTVSDLGNGFFRLALPWLIYDLTHSVAAMGLLAAFQYATVVLMPWAGALADRYGPRRTLLVSSTLQMALALLIPVLDAAHRLSLVEVFSVTLGLGGGSLVTQAATTVLVRRETPIEARLGVNSFAALLFNISWYLSPALAGLVISLSGVMTALVLDAASFLGVLVPALMLKPLAPAREAFKLELRTSWQAFREARGLLPVTAALGIWNLTWGGVYALEVFYFRQSLHLTAGVVGLIGTLGGLFPFVLGVLAPWLIRRIRTAWLMALTLITSGCGMAALGVTTSWPEAALSVNVMDGAISPILITQAMIEQESVPQAIYGRVTALGWVIAGAALPMGSLLAGILAPHVGTRGAMAIMGALSALGGILSLRWLRGVGTGAPSTGAGLF